jgi:hypothetical protein
MGRQEMVTLQLWHGKRRVGDRVQAYLEWRDTPELRRHLVDAVKRHDFDPSRIGEFSLEVRDERGRRHLTTFVATAEGRR